ncbi:hypothetical protein N7509_001188 [Penicillium cosmopolitanum]|uniref:Uncharacterized protein n=1 Tax=Penicillium cosmopolitanum TaxID=1131564 RepID=A0A9W9WBQ2_9EURO|nr:uncharacterized protein N7509_001188 [Penicillium cosmopolitanum]KAJ5414561.1 hypothetical protein N7509_001188 [Penicillium cosmopolitanum]
MDSHILQLYSTQSHKRPRLRSTFIQYPPNQHDRRTRIQIDKATDSQTIRKILEAESKSYFEDLEEQDIFTFKYCNGKATETQQGTLKDTAEEVWNSLRLLCETNIEDLDVPYLDTKEKQEMLKTAMREREINVESLVGFIRLAWPKYLDYKKKFERQVQRKERKRQERLKEGEKEKTASTASTTQALAV